MPAKKHPQVIAEFQASQRLVEGQCDACSPLVGAVPSTTIRRYGLLQTTPVTFTGRADPSYHLLLGRKSAPALLNDSALSIWRHFDRPRRRTDIPARWQQEWGERPVEATVDKFLHLGLLAPAGQETTMTEQPTTLAAWLHVTGRCNLHCSYCYLPPAGREMSPETGRAAIRAIFRSAATHNYPRVKLKYAGGESLLRFPPITELHQYAHILAKRHGRTLDGVVLSNGTLLTAEMLETMQALNLRLMISLDSLGNGDCQRPYPTGRSSAADAMQAIELALGYGLVPDISITVSGRNAESLPELITWVLERDLPFSLNFYRENDRSAAHTDLQLEEDKIISGMLAAYKVIQDNLPQRSLLASLVDRANLSAPHLRTCSVGHSYLVFDTQGQVSKCQMQMDKPVAAAGADDPLALVRGDKRGIQNRPVDEKEGCGDCEWRYWCAGGCPLAAYRVTGRYDVKSPNCKIYKTLYPEAIRLEGLRLLKYAHLLETA